MKKTKAGLYGKQLMRLGTVNSYLVRETDGCTPIEVDLKASEDSISEAPEEVPIKRILLTHPHIDHVGSVDALMAKIPNLQLLCSERSIPISIRRLIFPSALARRVLFAAEHLVSGVKVSQTIAHGERVRVTPGNRHAG